MVMTRDCGHDDVPGYRPSRTFPGTWNHVDVSAFGVTARLPASIPRPVRLFERVSDHPEPRPRLRRCRERYCRCVVRILPEEQIEVFFEIADDVPQVIFHRVVLCDGQQACRPGSQGFSWCHSCAVTGCRESRRRLGFISKQLHCYGRTPPRQRAQGGGNSRRGGIYILSLTVCTAPSTAADGSAMTIIASDNACTCPSSFVRRSSLSAAW